MDEEESHQGTDQTSWAKKLIKQKEKELKDITCEIQMLKSFVSHMESQEQEKVAAI